MLGNLLDELGELNTGKVRRAAAWSWCVFVRARLTRVRGTGKRVTPEGESELITGGLKYNWSAQQEPPLLVEEARLREEKRVEVAKSGEATEA